MSKALLTSNSAKTLLQNVNAAIVAGESVYAVNVNGTQLNPGLQRLVLSCLAEMKDGAIQDSFIDQLSHFNRLPSERNLKTKLHDCGCPEDYYDFAIEAKEAFAKFFEVTARHASGQAILVAAFRHAYSLFREKVSPYISSLTFAEQNRLFEDEVVSYLSHNLTGLPEFYGRMEALGLLFFLADNCFIEYAKC